MAKTLFDTYIKKLPKKIIDDLKNTSQDPKWHPEGNVYNHTKLVFNAVLKNFGNDEGLLLSGLFHDLGKIDATKSIVKNGIKKIVAYGHEFKSLAYIDTYFHLFSDDVDLKDRVHAITKNHMRAHMYIKGTLKNPAKRKAFEDDKFFADYMKFAKCDDMGKHI